MGRKAILFLLSGLALLLTGNAPGINNAAGSTPGLGIMKVEQGGRQGELRALIPITHPVNGIELADPHGIAVRRK